MDKANNFARADLLAGIDDTATTLTISTADAARFAVPPFNAPLWNCKDYPDASDDPDREVVRVTDIGESVGSSLIFDVTIVRAQEGTAAAAHNDATKVYRLSAGPTAKLITDLGCELIELPYDSANFTTSDYEGGPATWAVPDNGSNKVVYGRSGNIGLVSVKLMNTANTLSGGVNEDELRITLPDSMIPATGSSFTIYGTLHWKHLLFGGLDGGWEMGVIAIQDAGVGTGPAYVTLSPDLSAAGTWDGTTTGSGYIMWGTLVYPLKSP